MTVTSNALPMLLTEVDATPVPVDLFRRSVEENLEQLRPFIGRFVQAKDFDELHAAHLHLVAAGEPGYVDATGALVGPDPLARRAELAALGARLIGGQS